ncbi:cobalt-precorrin-6A reductase CbiJ [Gottschalkia purinilytica]|uniref:Cobalt-precorrin-6A reductase CbiJ n=1 Tax=Gottschalkia purinilytica TaxID=1503 RepID=A0A0L0W797_GOTPU|nr:precorrin-6A reductase [Gottschalkia purinilytica]KNF07351.1 cobalt-precorrin-6A reductase CbiJ [Gottschalkia purinilytica]
MIWIIGGTKETSYLINKMEEKVKYVVTVATYAGKEMLNNDNVIVSRLNYEDMIKFIKERNIDIIIDMSHPYAIEATSNARSASKECNIKYIRYVREKTYIDGVTYFNNIQECCEFLKSVDGCVFFTTGIKNIKDFEKVRGKNRFIYRVLPSKFSIEECIINNINMKDIVACVGPFSEEFNMSMFKEFNSDYVVMKDSGDIGGTHSKISACLKAQIKPIIIGREDENGVHDIEELVEMIK